MISRFICPQTPTIPNIQTIIAIIQITSIQYLSMKILVLLITLIVCISAADDGDWVDPFDLPIEFPVRGFYAGYLNITQTKALYYVYTPSDRNPSKDPLVILLPPGPGCSPLQSFLYSKGPFIFVSNTTNFRDNPFNWNKQANVLYIEGPAGVGFSVGGDETITQQSATRDYFRAIMRFYQKFPQLKDQKMYLSGSQYTGITTPRVALNIIEHNRNPNTPAWLRLNLTGLFLYNPCTFAEQCDNVSPYNKFTVQTLRNHFFISKKTYEDYKSYCTLRTRQCARIEQKIQSDFRITGADIHNLYKQCLHQPGDYGCIDHLGIDAFLNSKEVKIDMNADTTIKWNLCNSTILQRYERDPDGALKIYQTLLRQQHNLRIWIVSGTQSAHIPTIGTKTWVDQLKMNMRLPTLRLWQPWFYRSINSGQVEQMRGLTFLTIRSAGYFMFEDQPQIANHVYKSFLNGTPL